MDNEAHPNWVNNRLFKMFKPVLYEAYATRIYFTRDGLILGAQYDLDFQRVITSKNVIMNRNFGFLNHDLFRASSSIASLLQVRENIDFNDMIEVVKESHIFEGVSTMDRDAVIDFYIPRKLLGIYGVDIHDAIEKVDTDYMVKLHAVDIDEDMKGFDVNNVLVSVNDPTKIHEPGYIIYNKERASYGVVVTPNNCVNARSRFIGMFNIRGHLPW